MPLQFSSATHPKAYKAYSAPVLATPARRNNAPPFLSHTGGAASAFDEPIADATFCPTGAPESALGLDLDRYGNFWRQSLYGREKIGAIDATGHYWFVNGQQGDFFESRNPAREGLLEIDLDNQPHPVVQALRARERQRALAGSDIPALRARLNPYGITGRGVKIGVLDPYEPGDEIGETGKNQPAASPWKVSDHSKATSTIINDPTWGLAPGAQVVDAGFAPKGFDGSVDADDINAARSNFMETACNLFDETSQRIYQLLQQKTPDLRVISLTWGASMLSVLDSIQEDLNILKENGDYLYPNARRQILGPALHQGPAAQQQALLNFITQTYYHPKVQQARQRYIEVTRQAAAQGVTIVAAAGNEHGQNFSRLSIPPGMEMDELAKSPYVISVAASDTHQTPGYRGDDSIAYFSSRGDGLYFNPTVAAPGQNIYISRPYETLSGNQVESGTSFAVPYVCSVIALLLQVNPSLTFEQIKSLLQQTAYRLPDYPVAAQGAGVVQPEAALQALGLPLNQAARLQSPLRAHL